MSEESMPIYVDEGGQIYMYEEKTGNLFELKPGDYAGAAGWPMPGVMIGKGAMTMIGKYHVGD